MSFVHSWSARASDCFRLCRRVHHSRSNFFACRRACIASTMATTHITMGIIWNQKSQFMSPPVSFFHIDDVALTTNPEDRPKPSHDMILRTEERALVLPKFHGTTQAATAYHSTNPLKAVISSHASNPFSILITVITCSLLLHGAREMRQVAFQRAPH